jgi:hypothetical protein
MLKTATKRTYRGIACFAAASLSLLFATSAAAQSGRRATGAVPTSTPSEQPDEHRSQPASTATLVKPVTLLIAKQPTSKRYTTEDSIRASFVKRLGEFSGVTVTSIGDLKRSDAVKRAKGEKEALVVLLHFDIDSFQEGTIILDSRDLEVMYAVFAPRSGKQQSKGKVYYQEVGGGRLRKSEWPNGTPIRITTELAGIEAAEQLYSWLALMVGVKHTP